MKWLDSAFLDLKNNLRDGPFSAKEAFIILNKEKGYPRNSVYWILYELVKRNSLVKLGRGVYTFPNNSPVTLAHRDLSTHFTVSDKVIVEVISGGLSKAREKLNEKGIEFMFTGPSVLTRFHHYMSWRYIHLVYVIEGSGDYSVKILKEAGFLPLLNPKIKEIEIILENIDGKDLFIIREFSDLEGNLNGRASMERALVDTYFEATRNKIPYSEVEVGRIIINVFREVNIDITKMLHFAERRSVRDEFGTIIKEIVPNYPLTLTSLNEHVNNVLLGIRE
jgi:hypothetical protein